MLRAARQLHGAHLHRQEPLAGRARHLQALRDRPGSRHAMERLRALRTRVLARQRAVPVPDPADPALPVPVRWARQRHAGDRVEYGRVVHHQHQLAELLRRVHHELPDPDVGARGAELPVRRGRAGGGDRDDPRVHPVQDGQARQLLGGPDPGHHPAAAAAGGDWRADPGGRGRDRELRLLPHDHHAVRSAPDHRRWPGRLAGGHQGDGQQRRRFLQRQLGPSVREPEPVHEHLRDLPDPAHPVQPASRCWTWRSARSCPAASEPGCTES
jgi:hypothetical protein